jgi:hypothetical protein
MATSKLMTREGSPRGAVVLCETFAARFDLNQADSVGADISRTVLDNLQGFDILRIRCDRTAILG